MSTHFPRPRAVGWITALLGCLVIAALETACTRNAAATAATAATDAPKSAASAEASKSGADSAKSGGDAAKTGSTPAGSAARNPADATAAQRKAAEAEKDKARQAAAEMVPVETALVTRGTISAFLGFNTTLETESTVDIYPQTAGQVETLMVEEGKVVKEGDPLLKIEDRELRLDVEETNTNFEHLQKGFARTEDLYQRKLVNKQDFEDQRFQLEQARLKLERARVRLSYATVRAPFDGVISAREVQEGARVGSGTKLFSMVKLDDLVARVFVPGRYLPVVAVDQSAVVTSEFLPDRSFKGWVKRISPVIDPKSGTFKVTVGVRGDKPSELPPGLFVGVRIITDTRADAVLIPKRAVVYEGGERYVFTITKDRAMKRKLIAGFEDPQNIEAVSGIAPGETIIVLGHSGLKDGAMVRAVNALAPIPVSPPADAPEAKATVVTPAPAKAEKS